MTTKKAKPTPAPTPPQSPAAFEEAALAAIHHEEAKAAAPAKTVLVPAYQEADAEKLLATKKALRELFDATPADLARVFDTPEAYSRYISARAEALKHL